VMISWDVEKGFVKGAVFEKNELIKDLTIKDVVARTSYKLINKDDEDKPIEDPSGSPGGSTATTLAEVIVTSKNSNNSIDVSYISFSRSFGDLGISVPKNIKTLNIYNGGATAPKATNYTTKPVKPSLTVKGENLPPCIQKILAKLTMLKNMSFKEILEKLGGGDGEFNLTFEVVKSLPNNPNANAITDLNYLKNLENGNFNNYVIKIKESYINVATDLAIAQTIQHEMVHAYLLSIYGELRQNKPTTLLSNNVKPFVDLWGSIEQYGNFRIEKNQHEILATAFTNDMAANLQEYDTGKKPSSVNDIQQFYKDLAWGGLQETDAYKNLNSKDRDRIEATAGAEEINDDTVNKSNNNTVEPKGKKPCDK
jgi:hypothetical protein